MRKFLVLLLLASLSGPSPAQTAAETSDIVWDRSEQGVTPFISIAHLAGQSLNAVRTVRYELKPKPGSVSKAVRVTYTRQALKRRGRLTDGDPAVARVRPVCGIRKRGFDQTDFQ
jgi:hypothetical protein